MYFLIEFACKEARERDLQGSCKKEFYRSVRLVFYDFTRPFFGLVCVFGNGLSISTVQSQKPNRVEIENLSALQF